MKTLLTISFVAFAICLSAQSSSGTQGTDADRHAILQSRQAIADAWLRDDTETMGKIEAEDFVETDDWNVFNGLRLLDKKSELEIIRNKIASSSGSFSSSNPTLRFLGDGNAALLTEISRFTDPSGKIPTMVMRSTTVWRKETGQWKLAYSHHSYLYVDDPAALKTENLGASTTGPDADAIRRLGATLDLPLTDNAIYEIGTHGRPITGREQIDQMRARMQRSNQKLENVPQRIVISQSGDLAYEFGTSRLSFDQKDYGHIAFTRTYLRTWKKENGQWKVDASMIRPD